MSRDTDPPLCCLLCLCVWTAWAKVEVAMEDAVEVHLGDLAQISCRYSFTDVAAEPSDVIVQWFVVSLCESRHRPVC